MTLVTPRLLAYNVREPLGGAGGSRVDRFLAEALSFKGQPYKWGGGHTSSTFSKPGPVDCSGLVMQAARMAGFNLDGTAAAQQDMGRSVSMSELKPGDLLFRGNPAYHVGIYLGNGQALHAPKTGDVVRTIDADYFTSARRVIEESDRAEAPKPAEKPRPSSNAKPERQEEERDHFARSATMDAAARNLVPGPSYVPQPGETLLAIAERTLGDSDRWMEIYLLNRNVMPSPYVLFPGQPIVLPQGAKVDAAAAPAAVAPAAPQPVAATTGTVGTFQHVQAFLGGAKDKLAQVMAGMAMA